MRIWFPRLRARSRQPELVCQQVVELVTDYLEGALSADRPAAVRAAPGRLPALHRVPGPDAGDDPAGRPGRPGGPDAGHARRPDRPVPPLAGRGLTRGGGHGGADRRAGQVLDQPVQLSAWMTITGPAGRIVAVLLVPLGERVDRVRDRALVFDDARPAVDADPPELVPVVGVVVGQQRDPGVLPDVAEALQLRRRLRLVIDGDVDQVVIDGERDRHQIRLPVRARRRQPGHPRAGQPGPRLFLVQSHPPIVPPAQPRRGGAVAREQNTNEHE